MLSTRRSRADQISLGCRDATRRLRDLSAMAFLTDVRPLTAFRGATTLLRRDAAYREVYRMWLALRQHPFVAFDSPLFHLPIADLPRLYEIWCVLQVVQALLACGGTVHEQRLLEGHDQENTKEDLEFAIDLVADTPLLVIDHGECRLILRYQPHYRPLAARPGLWPVLAGRRSSEKLVSLDRHTHIPDIAIEVQRPGAPPRVLLLDAKYRLDSAGRSVPQDALADAYTYLGAIGCAGSPATLGALLLYPGHGTPELYPSRVGTLPLLPGSPTQLGTILAEHLDLRR
jgi:large subunit ribosomal protein MRP49